MFSFAKFSSLFSHAAFVTASECNGAGIVIPINR